MSRRLVIVVVALALFGASTGGAIAAGRYVITRLDQIKPSVRRQLVGRRGPAGTTGPAGPQGTIAGEFEVTGNLVTISPGSPVNSSTAACPAGDLVLSGGWKGLGPDATVPASEPTTVNGAQGWAVEAALVSNASSLGVSEESFQAVALCAVAASA